MVYQILAVCIICFLPQKGFSGLIGEWKIAFMSSVHIRNFCISLVDLFGLWFHVFIGLSRSRDTGETFHMKTTITWHALVCEIKHLCTHLNRWLEFCFRMGIWLLLRLLWQNEMFTWRQEIHVSDTQYKDTVFALFCLNLCLCMFKQLQNWC
jgi:hypothetical protein